MKLLLVIVAALVAVVAADVGAGLKPVPGGVAAPYRNDFRQHGVNRAAEKTGASSGTARYDGVPGSGGFYGYYNGYPGYYYGGYPGYYGGYGYGYGYGRPYGRVY